MGCWNGTCGISQIHIRAGEPVVAFALTQNRYSDLCDSTCFWSPFIIPFYGEYNDYGDVDGATGIGLKLMLAVLKRELWTGDDSDDADEEFSDEDEDDSFYASGESMFWEHVHRGKLFVKGTAYNPKVRVDKVLIKKSVLDHLAANYVIETYDWHKDTYERTFFSYTFNDVLASIPGVIDQLFNATTEEPEGLEDVPEEHRDRFRKVMKKYNTLEKVCSEMVDDRKMLQSDPRYNRAASWFSYEPMNLQFSGLNFSLNSMIVDLVDAGNRDTLTELLNAYATTLFVDHILMDTRKAWSPQVGAGSQAEDDAGYRAIAAAMIHVLDEEAKEREEY